MSNISKHCTICDPKSKYSNCICHPSWHDFNKTLKIINDYNNPHILNSLRISTITLCCNYNINVDMYELMDKYPCKNNGKFYNSAIFNWKTKYQTKLIVSIKVFPNGKVQIAGVSTIMSCAYIIRKVQGILEKFSIKEKDKNTNKNKSKSAKITDVSLAMINSDFKITKSLNLAEFCTVLSNNIINTGGNISSIIYQPVKYPAINLKVITDSNLQEYNEHFYKFSSKKKFSKQISVLIFRSGSIIITGGNDIKEYFEVYKYILQIIKKNYDLIII